MKNDEWKKLQDSATIESLKAKAISSAAQPKDEEFWKWLWGARKVKAPEAWNLGYTGAGIIVAVVDTGVDGTHPDLQGQLVTGYRPLTRELLSPDMDSSYGGSHGTHVAGTIAAKDNDIGIIGVAPNAKIMPIVIFDDLDPNDPNKQNVYIGDDLVAEGFLWAAENGAKIFSNSWGGKGYSITLAQTIALIMKEYNGIFVASAGNSHTDEIHYPSCYPGVINVAASTAEDGITYFSTRGRWITVAAPGDFTILSTVPGLGSPGYEGHTLEDEEGGTYDFYGGTSMATPHVSGVIALLLEKLASENKSYTPYQIRKHIAQTADDIMAPGFDHDSGWGRVNAYKALTTTLPKDTGANVLLRFYVEINGEYRYAPEVYVTMYPENSNVPIYYGKSNDDGEVFFAAIEPGKYDVYACFGDVWYLQNLHGIEVTIDDQLTKHFEFTFANGDTIVPVFMGSITLQ
ncbi:S8 family serine peptidase [Pseudothermotoga thermarum]|uniref:S8 family serine peptidase n=1 Tax=Pseudothermotoga thermarum TaxID=119394 RepID=UPI0003127F21|nr:S8 family serine peptidase [Pseudothermotoga thermarum]